MKRSIFFLLLALIVIIGAYVAATYQKKQAIASFDDCAAAGYPIQESYPERCAIPGGKTFTKIIAGESITLTGEFICLPHKNKGQIQTMECAFGLKTAGGEYYALSDPEMKYLMDIPTGKQITVSGIIDPTDTRANSIYDIVGTLNVKEVR